jgi:hypothetical protein
VRTWQYYLYDAHGVDLARANGASREVIPFGQQVIPDGTTIVWRVVLIGVAPKFQPGFKGAEKPY